MELMSDLLALRFNGGLKPSLLGVSIEVTVSLGGELSDSFDSSGV